MKVFDLRFGVARNTVKVSVQNGYDLFFDPCIKQDIQFFIDHISDLKINEPFYFGFWRVIIEKRGGVKILCEWDFINDVFVEGIGRSLCLWTEQKKVLASQSLPWTSVGIDQLMYVTPNVFAVDMKSTVEGVRDVKNAPDSSGWLLYTASDRNEMLPFSPMSLNEALKIFNVNVLRFLALPDGWTFNIETNGMSHVWMEALSEMPVN